MTLKNPLMDEIKTNLMFAYEVALCACSVINERFNCIISQDEVGYYALHLKVAMDEAGEKRKKSILLVCSSGRGSAQLLKIDFWKKFKNYLEKVETCNVFELSKIDLSEYTCIFSTVPINMHLTIPMFRIKYFLDAETDKLVHKILQSDKKAQLVEAYFDENLFNGRLCANTKKEAIMKIIDQVGKKIKLPENFLESVMNRENLEDTQLSQLVALPHPDGVIGDDTIISLNVLEKPVEWGKGNVQIVILISFAKGFVKNNDLFFEFVTEFIGNKSLVNRLIGRPTFDTFKAIIEEVCREEI
jgi:lichenan operon transcriptional antiterminator